MEATDGRSDFISNTRITGSYDLGGLISYSLRLNSTIYHFVATYSWPGVKQKYKDLELWQYK